MEYKLVISDSPQKLVDLVEQEIQKGWKPQGGLAIEGFGISTLYYQAMVKER